MTTRGHDEPLLATGETSGRSKFGIGKIIASLVLIGGLAVGGFFIYKEFIEKSSDSSTQQSIPADVQAMIKSLMDTKRDPCQDFYEYACGGFNADLINPYWRNKTTPYVRAFDIQGNKTHHELVAIIEGNYPKVSEFYTTCKDNVSIEAQGYEVLKPWVKLIQSINDAKSFWRVLGTLQRHGLADDAIISYGIDSIDLVHRMLFAAVPDATVPFRQGAPLSILKVMRANNLTNIPEQTLEPAAQSFQNFLWDLMLVVDNRYGINPDNYTMIAVDSWAKDTGIDLTSYLIGLADTTITSPGPYPNAIKPDRAFLSFIEMWFELGNFFNVKVWGKEPTYPVETLQTYLLLHTIIPNLDALPRALKDAWENPSFFVADQSKSLLGDAPSKGLHGVPNLPPLAVSTGRSKQTIRVSKQPAPFIDPSQLYQVGASRADQCFEGTRALFGDLVTKAFVDKYYPGGNKAAGKVLAQRIKEQMGQRLREVDWLDEPTRQQALRKWEYIASNVAYPDQFDDYATVTLNKQLLHDASVAIAYKKGKSLSFIDTAVNRAQFPAGVDVLDQNAFYYPGYNSINLLAGLMDEPLFGSRLADVQNLAAYGFVIGHEITHGFDNHGREWNGTGFHVDWWTANSTTEFNKRAQCLIDQYDEFELVPGLHVRGEQTLGENIADLGGIGNAWSVYKRQNIIPQLMSNTNITNDQLFWIQAGQVWCSAWTVPQAQIQINYDVHSPGKFRINGPMSNLPAFADTFKCSADTPMGRSKTAKRCSVW